MGKTNSSDGRNKKDEPDLVRRELQDAIDRQTATNEILHLISKSPNDTQPIFDAIVQSGTRLFPGAAISIALPVGDKVEAVAVADEDPIRAEAWRGRFPFPLTRDYMHGIAILEAQVVDIPDVANSPSKDSAGAQNFLASGYRAVTLTPLLHNGKAIGVLGIVRLSPGPLSDEQLAVLQTFAAQAVIAIENVRQFRELQARLAREAATRKILEVISLNPDDEQPIFDTILESATKLCKAPHGVLLLRNSEDTHLVFAAANTEKSGIVKTLRENPHSLSDDKSLTVEAVKSMEVRQYRDIEELRDYQGLSGQLKATLQLERMRTLLYVPLIKGDRAIGVLALYRLEVSEFTDDDIELLKTFAAQAVIAIENVRQFKALESLNAELGDRVEAQVGEIERMGRLKRFLPAAVADTVISQGSDKMLSSHRALLGVLFCDIRGFTAFCETAEPEETIEVLQTYHEEMGKLINTHGAGVDHRMGDGIMVLFNDPLPCEDPAGEAVRLAIAMRARMTELSNKWKRLGYRLGFGVGVSLGYATVGMVGFEGRFDYTASGTAINLAARLCDEAEDGEILLSPRAGIAVEDAFQVESRGEISLKGIREPVEVFKLTGAAAT